MNTTNKSALRDFKPLLKKTDGELEEFHQVAGMHPAYNDAYRGGIASLTMRRDVSMGDALEAMDSTLQHLTGMLETMARDEEGDSHLTTAAAGCGLFVLHLRGLRALLEHGVLQHSSLGGAEYPAAMLDQKGGAA